MVADLSGFLDEPRVAVLGTHRRDGQILLSPVWHRWREGGFDVWTAFDDVKARHVRRDPRASIVVAESRFPLRGVELRAEARIVLDGAAEAAAAIAERYLGSGRGRPHVSSVGGEHVILRLEPGDLRIWDFADDDELREDQTLRPTAIGERTR